MLNKILKHKFKILIAILIVLCFAVIRAFENKLFYDPFLIYFESDFKNLPLPQVEFFKLFCSLVLRFVLNTALSLMLIYTLFQDRDILRFSALLYGFFIVILLGLFIIILECFPEWNWLLFYVRRFIIQPIFVILFIPAFYYQQQNLKK
ncbi:exosortase F system-associated membrane protein [Flavobacterium sp. FlaQc-48]|uniref:exosortase F system-associated membrane protein n=1 Tax=Flavobacterium sp. FlaQc-48 TaxID=3374181 RepID=UPI003756C805